MPTVLRLIDPFRIKSTVTKELFGSSFETLLGLKGDGASDPQKPTGVGTSPVVDDPTTSMSNLGRAALINTSPSGVQGTDPTLRYKLLGNNASLGN